MTTESGLPPTGGELQSAALQSRFRQAQALHRQGQLAQAERLYAAILESRPDHAPALHLLGVLAAQAGRLESAVELIARALAIDPRQAPVHFDLGNALKFLGRHGEAVASYDKAIALAPHVAEIHLNRGAALAALGRHEQAIAGYDTAIALRPDLAAAHNERGNALAELGRPAEAIAGYDRAIALQPDLAAAHGNRGVALGDLKRHEESIASFDRAIALRPDDAVAFCNRGGAKCELRRHDAAIADFDRAIAIDPGFAGAFGNRGIALNGAGRREEAVASYDRAIALQPGYADAHFNRGNALLQLKRFDEAARSFDRVLELNPDFDHAPGYRLSAKLQVCDWSDRDAMMRQITQGVRDGRSVVAPFAFLAMGASAADQLACARIYGGRKYPAAAQPLWTGERYRHERIRLAYLSADFRDHPVAVLIAGLFELHDRSRFEVHAFASGPDEPGEMRDRLRRSFDTFNDVARDSDDQVARALRGREIDIAIDLNGFTDNCRPGIFARRPAPVQVNYLGYPGTMGASYFDYIVGDDVVIPPDHEPFYSEKVVRLSGSYQVNDAKRRIAESTPRRAAMGLPESGFVFCCFNNSYKISPPVFDAWMRLLGRVEGSVLWLLEDSPRAAANLRREAQARGIAPGRLVFASRLPLADHLARHRLADLFLDTLPYNAHTTASDALWAGLPVLTCLGETFCGRVAASLLNSVGLPELVTTDLAGYEAAALRLATTPGTLARLKAGLTSNRARLPPFDTDRFRRHIERAYETMVERHRRGLPPAGFAVALQD